MSSKLPWTRLYRDTINNKVIQGLPDDLFKFYVNCMCLADPITGELPDVSSIAFATRSLVSASFQALESLWQASLLTKTGTNDKANTYALILAEKLSFKSDTSTERVKRFRERSRNVSSNVSCNVTVTAQKKTKIQIEKPPISPPTETVSSAPLQPKVPRLSPLELRVEDIAGFEMLWDVWRPYDGMKGSKQKAMQALAKILKTGVTLKTIGPMAERYIAYCHDKETFTQHLVTWLNQKGWEDAAHLPKPFNSQDPRNAII